MSDAVTTQIWVHPADAKPGVGASDSGKPDDRQSLLPASDRGALVMGEVRKAMPVSADDSLGGSVACDATAQRGGDLQAHRALEWERASGGGVGSDAFGSARHVELDIGRYHQSISKSWRGFATFAEACAAGPTCPLAQEDIPTVIAWIRSRSAA